MRSDSARLQRLGMPTRLARYRSTALLVTSVLVAAMLLPVLGVASATPAPPDATEPRAKIANALLDDLRDGAAADFWITFADSADTSAAREVEDWTERGQRTVDILRKTAAGSQAHASRYLDQHGVDYEAFWAVNALLIEDATETIATDLAELAEVDEIRAPQSYDPPEPVEMRQAMQTEDVAWGVANVNADDVWADHDVRGDGIVVATIDSGVQFDHPALVDSYRGNNGDGTFDHDYNWLDTAEACDGAPCDVHDYSHGTHVTGTIAGESEDNRIGVAPGVRWIAANGCAACTEPDLVAAAEWMLAPTDTDGENADPSMRPHIINNSWGSRVPSTAPFREDNLQAWADSGMFAVWANGNSGPACSTSGSPGSRTLTYSVGAYDSENVIAESSARGPGQDDEIKPNISAPGVEIRSAVNGGNYALLSGTSMAAPHVAGAVALLWSADPTVIGDVDATRALLNQTAIDTPDDQCGGEPGDNNVYGEGRLDALALVENQPGPGVGTLAGSVTDGATEEPIENATVTATGPIERQTTTAADGTYSLILVPGEYEVSVTAFGYGDKDDTVKVVSDETTTHDVGLAALDTVTVSGDITDGSGHGWPLYARVTIVGSGVDSVYTDPYTGEYSLRVPADTNQTLQVVAQYPGYRKVEQTVEAAADDLSQPIEVPVDTQSCTAEGYHWAIRGVRSSFDGTSKPDGWTVVDNNDSGYVWRFDDPGDRGNRTGGEGGFAIFDGDAIPNFIDVDSTLITPTADLSDVAEPALTFNTRYRASGNATGEIDLSLDGGDTWENVWRKTGGGIAGYPVTVELPQAANEADARIRFRYSTVNSGRWQIDDVVLGEEHCAPTNGGLVAGEVVDGNNGDHLAGARIVSDDAPEEKTLSGRTPNDPTLSDGFYWMFSSRTGEQGFTASRAGYQQSNQQVDVAAGDVTRSDFTLSAGKLRLTPPSVDATQVLGQSMNQTVTVANEGTAAVNVRIHEDGGGFATLTADEGAPTRRTKGNFTPALQHDPSESNARGRGGAEATDGPAAPPWQPIANLPTALMDNAGVTADDGTVYTLGGATSGRTQNAMYAYDPDEDSWSPRAAMAWQRSGPAAAYIDGKIYVVGGAWTNGQPVETLEIYSPSSDSWTTGTPAPRAFRNAAVGVVEQTMYVVGGCSGSSSDACGHDDVLAYDPGKDSWSEVAPYPEPVSFAACGGIGGKLYCAGGVTGADGSTSNAYTYDPEDDAWAPIAQMPLDLWGAGYSAANGRLLVSGGATNDGAAITNEGVAYDPAADAWESLPNANLTVFRGAAACGFYKVGGSTGGFSRTARSEKLPGYARCGAAADLSWLSAEPDEFTLQPEESAEVDLTLDATEVDQPGTYSGRLTFANNSPYGMAMDVTMNVEPPRTWTKVAGTVLGERCDAATVPLSMATIALDTSTVSHTLRTDSDGRYGIWFDRRGGGRPTVVAALDGWRPDFQAVSLQQSGTTEVDFTLPTTLECD